MEAVLCAMDSERLRLAVVRADTVSAWEQGECAGAWSLGPMGAECVGTILWCSGHVYVVRSSSRLGGELALRASLPPWMHDDVARGKAGKVSKKKQASLAAATAARWAQPARGGGERCWSYCQLGTLHVIIIP